LLKLKELGLQASEEFMKNEFERVKASKIPNLLSLRVVEENFFVWEALVTFETWPYINRAFKILFEFPGELGFKKGL
jgi:hypothetical protein